MTIYVIKEKNEINNDPSIPFMFPGWGSHFKRPEEWHQDVDRLGKFVLQVTVEKSGLYIPENR